MDKMSTSRPLSPQPLTTSNLSATVREFAAGKTQRWLDVEARLVSNSQEFQKHRQEVQLQLREIHESLQRAASNESTLRQRDARFEAEVERVKHKLEQLTKFQDEMVSRFGGCQSAFDSAHDVLQTRFMEKLSHLSSTVEAHHRDTSKLGDGLLREATDAAKRASRSVAEELLRKMEELNTKLGENMANLEEQSAWGLKRVQQDVKDLASRLDGGSCAADAELRKLEARLEGTWRTRLSDMQSHALEASERAARADRDTGGLASQVSKLGSRLQECMTQIENLNADMKQYEQRLDVSGARVEDVQATMVEQIGRIREDMSALLHEHQRAHQKALNESQDHSQRLRAEMGEWKADTCARVDTFRDAFSGELASLRSVMGDAEHRVDDLASSLSTTRDGAQEELVQMQHAMHEELEKQVKQASGHMEDQLNRRTSELCMKVDTLRLELSELNGKHQTFVGEHVDQLAQLQDRAQGVSIIVSDWQKKADQTEQAVRQIKESNESREQRIRTMQLNLTEQIHQARDEVQRLCRDRIDESTHNGQRLHELQEQQLQDLRTDLHRRMDALEVTASEQTTAVGEHSRRLYEQACQQSRAWCDDAIAQSTTNVGEMSDRLSAQIKERGLEAETHRKALDAQHKVLEAQQKETSTQLRGKIADLQEHHTSWHSAEKERTARVDRTAKLCTELQQAKTRLVEEVESLKRTAQKQLEEQSARWEQRLESSMAGLSSQCSSNIAACRTSALDAAREAADKAADKAVREAADKVDKLELSANAQMRAHCEACIDDLKKEIAKDVNKEFAALRHEAREAQGHHVSRLAALSHEHAATQRSIDDRLQQHSLNFTEQLHHQMDGMRSAFEDQLHQHHGSVSRQLAEVGDQSAEKLRQHTATHSNLVEEVKRELTEQMRIMAGTAEERGKAACEKLDDKLSKISDALGQDVSDLKGSTRSLGERMTSNRDQHVEMQQKIEERLAQQMRSLGQELSEVKVVSAAHDDCLLKHQQQTADTLQKSEERLTKVLNTFGQDLQQLQAASQNVNERHGDLHARFENQQRVVAGLQEYAEEQTTKKLREHAQTIEHLQATTKGLAEGVASHQAKSADEHSKVEARLQQMVRDVQKDVQKELADLSGMARGLAEQLHSHKSQQANEVRKLAESWSEKLSRQSEKAAEQLTEVRDSFAEARAAHGEHITKLQQAAEAANEQLARLKDRSDEQQRDAKAGMKDLAAATQMAEKQLQESRQQLSSRCADADTRLTALRHELDQKAKHFDEEIANTNLRLQGVERRAVQDKDTNNALFEAQSHQTEKKIEASSEHVSSVLTEQMRTLVGNVEERSSAACQLLDDRLCKMVHTLDDRLSKSAHTLGHDLADLQGAHRSVADSVQELTTSSHSFSQQFRSVGQEVSDLKALANHHTDRLTKHQDQAADALKKVDERIDKVHHSLGQGIRELQSTSQTVNERCDSLQGSLDNHHRSLTSLHEQTKEQLGKRLQDHTQHIEDLHSANRGLTESLGAHKSQASEVQQKSEGRFQQMLRDVQKEVAELQTSVRGVGEQFHNQQTHHASSISKIQENLNEKLTRQSEKGVEQLTEVRDALAESTRHARDEREDANERIARLQQLNDAVNEQISRLKERGDEQQRETKSALKEIEQSLSESSQLAKKQLQECRQQFTTRIADGDKNLSEFRQTVEQKSKLQAEEFSAAMTRAVEDARRSAATALTDLAESAERRFREHGEVSAKSSAELSAQQSRVETELRNLVHAKSQGHEACLNEVREQVLVLEKDLKQVSDELPAINRRHESTRQAHSSALEEHKRAVQDRHTQLSRRVQGDADNLGRLSQQVGALQDEWKSRHHEQGEALKTAIMGMQEGAQQDAADLRTEIAGVQAGLQGVHTELSAALRSSREKNSAALTEVGRRQDEWMLTAQRRFEEVEGLASQARLLALFAEHVEGIVRAVAARELQAFQREALDSVEWKLERCVQWLHGANVKLGLNPHGTMFSTDRFRAMLFDESQKPSGAAPALAADPHAATPRTRRRANSASAKRLP